MKANHDFVKKMALVGILTALTAVLSFIKIPLVGSVTVTLILPAVVIGAVLCGPWVGAWLTVIPALTAIPEAALLMSVNPALGVGLLLTKGLLAGFAAGMVYKLMSKKYPIGSVVCAALVAPVVNSGVFVLGCRLFFWDALVLEAVKAEVSMGVLLIGLVVINFVVEMILNVVLCPTIIRIIQLATKKKTA